MAKKRGNNEGSITRRKDGLWMAQVTIGRDPQTGKLKRATFYGKTRAEVAEKLTTALRDLGAGTFVAPHRLTLGAWLDTWLVEYKRPAVRAITFDGYARVIRKHLTPHLGHIVLRDLRPEHLQRCYNALGAQGLSARTIRHVHVVLYGALMQAEKNGLIARNVATLVELPRVVRTEMQTLTLEQVAGTLMPQVGGSGCPWRSCWHSRQDSGGGSCWRCGGTTSTWRVGCSRSDAPWSAHMDRRGSGPGSSSRNLKRRSPDGRSRSPRCAPRRCERTARQAETKLLLGQAYDDHGLVVCQADGRPIDPRHFNRQFSRALVDAGLPHIRLHDSRHTFATLLLEQGVSPKTVQVLLGHASAQTTLDIYSHVSLELEHQAVKRLDAALGEGGN